MIHDFGREAIVAGGQVSLKPPPSPSQFGPNPVL